MAESSLRRHLALAAAIAAAALIPTRAAVALYTPREAAEESCRRVQEVRTPPSGPDYVTAPYEFGFVGGLPRPGESVDATVDWGDGTDPGRLKIAGPMEPGDPAGGVAHSYTEPGTYTWHATGSKIMLIAISPSEGNLPCAVPIDSTGTIVVSAPAGGARVVPPATTPPVPAAGGTTAAASPPEGGTAVAAGHTEPEGSGGSALPWLIVLGAFSLGAAVLAGHRAGLFRGGGRGGLTTTTTQLRVGERVGDAAEYLQNVHHEVSATKQAHDAEVARRREELVQHYLPTVGNDRGMAEVLADNDLSQYGSNAPMVNDVGQDVFLDATTKGIRDTWDSVTRLWNSTFGPKH